VIPLSFRIFLKASILVAEHELVDIRCHNGLVAFRRERRNVITVTGLGNVAGDGLGKQAVDHRDAARACSQRVIFQSSEWRRRNADVSARCRSA